MRNVIVFFCLIAAFSPSSLAQKPSFEVASIRPNTSGGAIYLRWPTGRFSATNVTVRVLLEFAYNGTHAVMPEAQIAGGPGWIDEDRFDLEAKPEGAARKQDMQIMMQSLLEDRFQLKTHLEMRELPVYNLVIAKGGPRLKLSPDQSPAFTFNFGMRGDSFGTTLTGTAVPVSGLADILQRQAGRPIVDKTELKGFFDIELQFNPALQLETAPSQASAPSLFEAIQELGLKFESAKAPFEVIVIDSIQKPIEN